MPSFLVLQDPMLSVILMKMRIGLYKKKSRDSRSQLRQGFAGRGENDNETPRGIHAENNRSTQDDMNIFISNTEGQPGSLRGNRG